MLSLQQISDTSNLLAGVIARTILRQNGVANEPWVYVPNTSVPKRVAVRIKPDGENQHESEIEFHETRVYPNPTSQDFRLEVTLLANNSALKVYSVDGKLVYHKSLKSGNQTIKVSTEGWSKGIYFIKVVQDETVLFEEKLTLQ